MDRDLLERYLTDGLSLPQIGAVTNRDPSTVGYWVQKHGLIANGRDKYAPRGGLTREQFEPFIERGATLAEIARELNRSTSTVWHWLIKHDLRTRGHRRHRPLYREADEAGVTRVEDECHRHRRTDFVKRPDGGWRCLLCRRDNVVNWRRRAKARLIEQAGGCCALCGYSRYQGALQFHHLDPTLKRFPLSRRGITRAFAELRAEAAKCALLCANCHAEVEAGITPLPVQLGEAADPE